MMTKNDTVTVTVILFEIMTALWLSKEQLFRVEKRDLLAQNVFL